MPITRGEFQSGRVLKHFPIPQIYVEVIAQHRELPANRTNKLLSGGGMILLIIGFYAMLVMGNLLGGVIFGAGMILIGVSVIRENRRRQKSADEFLQHYKQTGELLPPHEKQ